MRALKPIDAHTVEDDYHIIDKSEEMMRMQELLGVVDAWDSYDTINVETEGIRFI